MDSIAPNLALLASLLLLVSMLWIRRRQGQSPRPRIEDRLDTVQAWPAQFVPAMTALQRRAHDLLRQALPGRLILVQVPLSQFMRVATRHSYAEWYRRAGRLRASFLVCDPQSNPVAAIDLRLPDESERERARHARLVRVLEAAGLTVLVWTEDSIPTLSQLRARLASLPSEPAQPGGVSPAAALDAATPMSGALETMNVESTDFSELMTLPTPLDGYTGAGHAEGRPRPA